mmetsp:Transcript_1178/g.1847  ORF Transcript_1178/g.1847 Transcript_1178/m.1847 type:complete len:135 (-) Transcript_1178:800-1204(-)
MVYLLALERNTFFLSFDFKTVSRGSSGRGRASDVLSCRGFECETGFLSLKWVLVRGEMLSFGAGGTGVLQRKCIFSACAPGVVDLPGRVRTGISAILSQSFSDAFVLPPKQFSQVQWGHLGLVRLDCIIDVWLE